MGAASFLKNNRFSRPSKLHEYQAWLSTLERDGLDVATTVIPEQDDVIEKKKGMSTSDVDHNQVDILEVVMLALRTSDGNYVVSTPPNDHISSRMCIYPHLPSILLCNRS